MAKALAQIVEQAKLKAYHGSPYKFDEFSDDAIGTGEGAQAYGYGHYFAQREGTAMSYRDGLTRRNLDYEKYLLQQYNLADKQQNYLRMEMLERAMMHDSPTDMRDLSKNTEYDADYRQAAANMADEMEAFRDSDGEPVNFGSMYEVKIDAQEGELLDYDALLKDQSEKVKAIFPPDKYPETFTGRDLYDQIAGSAAIGGTDRRLKLDGMRESASNASAHLNKLGIKGIKYADAQTRFSPGEKTKNYVIFDPRIIEISRRYGIPITAAATMLQQQDAFAEEIPDMEAVERRAQAFANQRDAKNKAWSNLKDAVGKMTQPFQPLAEFVAHSAAGMASGAGAAIAYDSTQIPAETIERGREAVRGFPEQIGFGPIDENAYQIALNRAIEGIAETVANDNVMAAFVDPVMQDIGPVLLDQYQQLDPRTQGFLSGVEEYLGNVIR